MEGFAWIYDHVKRDLWLASISGGTDVVTAFVQGCPLLPVRAGELQCRGLGAKVEAFDAEGRSVVNQTGELVITEPPTAKLPCSWIINGLTILVVSCALAETTPAVARMARAPIPIFLTMR